MALRPLLLPDAAVHVQHVYMLDTLKQTHTLVGWVGPTPLPPPPRPPRPLPSDSPASFCPASCHPPAIWLSLLSQSPFFCEYYIILFVTKQQDCLEVERVCTENNNHAGTTALLLSVVFCARFFPGGEKCSTLCTEAGVL